MTAEKKKRKRNTKPNEFGAVTGVAVAAIVSAEPDEVSHNTWYRRLAGLIYTTSPTPVSCPIILRDPQFEGKISLRTMEKWCVEDKWVERRKRYFDQLEEGIKQKVQTAQLKSRFEQLQELDRLSGQMHTKLRAEEVEPGTFEGMVSGLVKVESMREDLRSKIAKEVVPENMAAGLGQAAIVPVLTEEEARVAALAIIKKRQEDAKRKKEENG